MAISYLKEHYGDIASVVGLLITFVGFLVTIRNVQKARLAAEDAQRAAREVVFRIRSQILGNEIGTGLQLVRAVDSGCRDRKWNEVLARCDEAHALLSKLADHQGLEDSERSSVAVAIRHLSELLRYVQKIRNSDPEKDIASVMAKQLHDIISALSRAQGRLESQNFGV